MIDREKAIAELQEYHDREWTDERKQGIPARDERRRITGNALELLKEQEPVDMVPEGGGRSWWLVCEECHGAVDSSDKFCRHCGKLFKRRKNGCDGCTNKGGEDCPLSLGCDRDVFCPNGKLR